MLQTFNGYDWDSVGLRLPHSMKVEIRTFAKKNNITVSDVIRRGVRILLRIAHKNSELTLRGGK